MPNSLIAKFDSMRYKGRIDEAEYQALTKKLKGHDSELLDKVLEKIKDCSYDMYSDISPYPETVVDMEDIDEIIKELKAEVEK